MTHQTPWLESTGVCDVQQNCHHILSHMEGLYAVKPNRGEVDLDQTCGFDCGILGRNMQHMQLKKVVKSTSCMAF